MTISGKLLLEFQIWQQPTQRHLGQTRRLTPIECERLQGFPDGWTKEVSDTQRYRQLGNAVTVNVIEAIINQFQEVSGNSSQVSLPRFYETNQ